MTADMQALRPLRRGGRDGRQDLKKARFDNLQARLSHGFPLDVTQKEVQEMLFKEAGGQAVAVGGSTRPATGGTVMNDHRDKVDPYGPTAVTSCRPPAWSARDDRVRLPRFGPKRRPDSG